MRAVVQRAGASRVEVDGQVTGRIDHGLVVLLGVGRHDSPRDARYLAEKIAHLRIFDDGNGKMNLSLKDSGGGILVVSQFTLWGDCRKGRRPGFSDAAPPEPAMFLYQEFINALQDLGVEVATGIFQAEMQLHILNDGPVTLLLDSEKRF